jgi:hypothetical protein
MVAAIGGLVAMSGIFTASGVVAGAVGVTIPLTLTLAASLARLRERGPERHLRQRLKRPRASSRPRRAHGLLGSVHGWIESRWAAYRTLKGFVRGRCHVS